MITSQTPQKINNSPKLLCGEYRKRFGIIIKTDEKCAKQVFFRESENEPRREGKQRNLRREFLSLSTNFFVYKNRRSADNINSNSLKIALKARPALIRKNPGNSSRKINCLKSESK